MRRVATVLETTPTLLAVSAPLTALVWTAFTWACGRRPARPFALIALVQVPSPMRSCTRSRFVTSLRVTASSIPYVHREARIPAIAVVR
jgi:hypothetical protein